MGMRIASVSGKAAAILSAERTALNLLQRMSGIATLTSRYVATVRGTNASVVDTRKTVPGLRILDKYSVLMGGGGNHRMSLADCILIKDNHIAAMKSQGMSIGDVVRHAKAHAPFSIKIEIEVETVDDAVDAMNAGAGIVMLDNMRPDAMRSAVDRRVGQALLEASGNVTLANRPTSRRDRRRYHLRRRADPFAGRPRHFAGLQRRLSAINPVVDPGGDPSNRG